MASEDMGLVQAQQRLDNGLSHPHLHFNDGYNHRAPPPVQRRASDSAAAAEPKATTRELTGGFIDNYQLQQQQEQQRYLPPATEFRSTMFFTAGDRHHQESSSHNLNPRSSAATLSGDVSEVEEEDRDDEDEDTDDEIDDRIKMGYQKSKQLSSFGSKESCNASEDNGVRNAVTVASVDGELYYSQYVQGMAETGQKDIVAGGNGCGFSGRKEGLYLRESRDSLRTILSDPLTGALMDDAMILPCGHSFGSGGIQHILRTKLCHTCFKAISEDSISPNLSLRTAVQAFRREEELQVLRASKKRKERYEQDRVTFDSGQPEYTRGKGVQFPFAVTDRVIIKGNKRTPPRFVGREAIVTTQCLNGWYVVKTLDNAESVKLQYRSLAKVPENDASPKPTSSKLTTPNWLQSAFDMMKLKGKWTCT